MNGLIAILLAVLSTAQATAASLPMMVDPIFKLTLPPSLYTQGFTAVPQDTLRACGMTANPTISSRYWILAETKAAGAEYLMISGILRIGATAPWSDHLKGAFLRLEGSACTPIDPLDEVFPYYSSYADDPDMTIAVSVFSALADDVVRRYARAFGSRANFVAALRAQHRYPQAPGLAILKDAVEAPKP